MMHGQSNIR